MSDDLAEPQDENTALDEQLNLRAALAARHLRNERVSEEQTWLVEERRDWLEATRRAVQQHQQGKSWWVDTAYDLLDECDALAAEIEQLRELNNTLGAAADTLGAAAADVGQLRDAVRVAREALERIGDEQHPRTALDFGTAIEIASAALARLPALPVEEQADE
jgi:hypothetical protein